MAKQKKPQRPKARRPRGFEDKPPTVLRAERRLVAAASAVYEKSGFEPLETSAFEYADALGTFLPDADRPNSGVFALQDDDHQWMSLRYDLTAPLARHVAENYDALAKPFRRWQSGSVWRNEKPGPGRFREFIQCDADSVGAGGPAADAEMIAMAADVMMAAGLDEGEYVIRYNDRRLLDGVLDGAAVPTGEDGGETRLTVLRAIDKLDRLGLAGVELLLGEGRKDDSGDFTKGAGLEPPAIKAVLDFVQVADLPADQRVAALKDALNMTETLEAVFGETAMLDACLSSLGVKEARAVLDPAIVRGLAYYTGPVFEAELLLEIENEKGQPVRVGSVGGGGRYDDLVARFKGQQVPATGFSFGVSRFASALRLTGRLDAAEAEPLAVVLAVEKDQAPAYFALAARLRADAGVRAELFVGGGNMGKQLKYADKRGARFAVIVGEDERMAGHVTVKDLSLGARMSAEIESNEEWRAARPAQETIAQDQLVSWIKAALADDAREPA